MTGYNNSTLKIDQSAILRIKGDFKFHTGAFVVVNKSAILEVGNGYTNNNVKLTFLNLLR